MVNIEYYDPKVRGYVVTHNLTEGRAWEVFTRLTSLKGEVLEQAKLQYSLNGCKLLFIDNKYGNIEIKDTQING